MFKFLKDKLKGAVGNLSKKIEEEGKEEIIEEVIEQPVPEAEPKEELVEEKEALEETPKEEPAPEKKGFLKKIFKKKDAVPEKEEEELTKEFEEVTKAFEEKGKAGYKKEELTEEGQAEEEFEHPEIKEEKEEITEEVHIPEETKPELAEEPVVQEVKEESAVEKTAKEESKKEEEEDRYAEERKKIEAAKVAIALQTEKERLQEAHKREAEKEELSRKATEISESLTGETPAPSPKKEEQESPGFFKKLTQKITTRQINETQFEEIFWDIEVALLENNVAVEVIEKIKNDLKANLVNVPLKRGRVLDIIMETLKESITALFVHKKLDLLAQSDAKKPLVICMVGINGSGKTTTIAKLVTWFQNNGKSCVLAAADTFRAAAIDQLQEHADKLGVTLIKHDYGADPAAVAFDAIKHAEAKGKDIVLIDTAGRLQSNVNLMAEMEKIIRVAKPDVKIFVGESITGNDCVEQAKQFDEAVKLDGIILSKADVDEKGGAALSVSYVTGKPILFLGTGQQYKDLERFNAGKMTELLGL